MSWSAGISGYLAYLSYLTFNRADFLFDYVFLSNDAQGGGGSAGMDVRAAAEEMVYKVRATSPSNRINHLLLTSANYVAAELKKKTRRRDLDGLEGSGYQKMLAGAAKSKHPTQPLSWLR